MTDTILIQGLKLFAYHGVNEEEKRRGQNFLLDISAKLDASAACMSDALADTVSYAAVLKTVRAAFTQSRYDLLERAAQAVADAVLGAYPPLAEVTVRVLKPDAPINAEFGAVGIQITRRNSQFTIHNSQFRAVIGLGSNLGEREVNLKLACEAMGRLPGTQIVRSSAVYETAPFGCDAEQLDYLNACVLLETALSPHALLGGLLGIEAACGRERPYPNATRTLDLDLLLYEGAELDTQELTLPHPRMAERAFVLEPLRDLFPEGDALGFMIQEPADRSQVKLYAPASSLLSA